MSRLKLLTNVSLGVPLLFVMHENKNIALYFYLRFPIIDNHVKNRKCGNFVSISSLTGECAAQKFEKNFCSSSPWTCLHHMVILRSQNKITDFLMILAWASPFKNLRSSTFLAVEKFLGLYPIRNFRISVHARSTRI